MSHAMKFSGPFTKALYSNQVGTNLRTLSNPLGATNYQGVVPSPHRRIYLIIQNTSSHQIQVTFSPYDSGASPLILSSGQSICLDNYNGGFSTEFASAAIFEAFA